MPDIKVQNSSTEVVVVKFHISPFSHGPQQCVLMEMNPVLSVPSGHNGQVLW